MAEIAESEGFITGGDRGARITPDFRLSEFRRADGTYFFHQDLAAALQELRDLHGAPIEIAGFRPAGGPGGGRTGLFAWVRAADIDALEAQGRILLTGQFAGRVERRGGRMYVEVSDPAAPPPLLPVNAMQRAIRVTAAFETSGDPFIQVTGNFDGAGLSFGPLQVNFKSGTLKTLFQRFAIVDAGALDRCFTDADDRATWQDVLKRSRRKQVQWADALSTGARKTGVAQPWKGYLQNVGREPEFQRETLAYAYDTYGRKLIRALSWLQGLTPVPIDNFACLSALYDLCVQQGSLDKAHDAIRARVALEHPRDQFELIRIAVEERGKKARVPYRADCVSRRLGILYHAPQRVTLSGHTATRNNPRLYLVRDVPVKEVERYLTGA